MKDVDGNEYKTVQIGKQIWMAENLRVTKFKNGDVINKIDSISRPDLLVQSIDPIDLNDCCNYNFDNSLDKEYGKLYSGSAIYDSRGIAPDGWKIPDNSDWQELMDELHANNNLWSSKEGFNNKLGGWWMNNEREFQDFGLKGYYWSSSLTGSDFDFENRLVVSNENLAQLSVGANFSWCAVRCLKVK